MSLSPPSPETAGPTRPLWQRIWAWRNDARLRKLYLNTGKLFSGHAVGALVGLGVIWFSTAGLGLLQFGILTAILSFTSLVGNTLKFSTWEAVVKYGADDLAREDRDAFRRLIAFNTLLDVGTALAALVICASLVYVVLPLIQVPREHFDFALFLCLSAFFTVSATPIGVLRLFDRFGLMAIAQPIGPMVRLSLCALFFYLGWGLWAFGAAYLASSAVDRAISVWFGWRELNRRDLTPSWHHFSGRATEGHPGLWKFVLANNFRISLGVLTKQSDDMIVAAFTGPTGVALWKIAKQVSSVVGGPVRLFVVSVYPQLAKLWSGADYRGFRRLIVRSSATATAGAVLMVGLFALVGPTLFELFFFKDSQRHFIDAFVPSLLLMGSRIATTVMSPFLPALTAMGRALRNLKLSFILALITVPMLLVLTWQFGLLGAGVSRILAEVLMAGVFGWTVLRAISGRIRKAAAAPAAPDSTPAAATS